MLRLKENNIDTIGKGISVLSLLAKIVKLHQNPSVVAGSYALKLAKIFNSSFIRRKSVTMF